MQQLYQLDNEKLRGQMDLALGQCPAKQLTMTIVSPESTAQHLNKITRTMSLFLSQLSASKF